MKNKNVFILCALLLGVMVGEAVAQEEAEGVSFGDVAIPVFYIALLFIACYVASGREEEWEKFIDFLKGKILFAWIATIMLLFVYFHAIISVGNLLVEEVFDPLFVSSIKPIIIDTIEANADSGFWKTFLIGTGEELPTMLGMLSTGLYVPFVMVFPFVLMFYLINTMYILLGFASVYEKALDPVMKRLGLSGRVISSFILAFGCKVPAILSTDTLGNKQSLLASMILIATIPCGVQMGLIVGVLAVFGMGALVGYFIASLLIFVAGLLVMKRMLGTEELTLGGEPMMTPNFGLVWRLFSIKIGHYLKKEWLYIFGGISILAFLNGLGWIEGAANALGGFFNAILGIPEEASLPFVMTLLQSEVGMGVLPTLAGVMSAGQAVVFVIAATRFFACMGVLGSFLGLHGPKKTILAVIGLFIFALLIGVITRLVLGV